jgi:DNA-binding NarL/FixJ family response regulator
MNRIRILLISDNKLLWDGIKAILVKQSDMHVAGSIDNGENLPQVLDKMKPDIILLDLELRIKNSLQIVKLSKLHCSEAKIILINIAPSQANVLEFVQNGVFGFILKDAGSADFLKTVRSAYKGGQILPKNLAGSLFTQIIENASLNAEPSTFIESVRLTKREREVMELIADGDTNKEIAQKLHLSTFTVKSHVHNILEKLALNTRIQIAKYTRQSDT